MLSIHNDFKIKLLDLRKEIGKFKNNHTSVDIAVSQIVNSLPSPLNVFGTILWEGLEKKDNSAEKLLITLEKISNTQERDFFKILEKLEIMIKNNPTKDDILCIENQIKHSGLSIINVLGDKIDSMNIHNEKNHDKTHQLLEEMLCKI